MVVQADDGLRLLTVEGIARWLERAADDAIRLEAVTGGDALACEVPGSFLLMARNNTVYDAEDAFRTHRHATPSDCSRSS